MGQKEEQKKTKQTKQQPIYHANTVSIVHQKKKQNQETELKMHAHLLQIQNNKNNTKSLFCLYGYIILKKITRETVFLFVQLSRMNKIKKKSK